MRNIALLGTIVYRSWIRQVSKRSSLRPREIETQFKIRATLQATSARAVHAAQHAAQNSQRIRTAQTDHRRALSTFSAAAPASEPMLCADSHTQSERVCVWYQRKSFRRSNFPFG